MGIVKKTFEYGGQTVTLETGRIARQATAAVYVTVGDTALLVTAVARKHAVEGQSFFPLTVNYQEKTYAAGKVPGGFFKREGRPSEKETLTSRLIDRTLRPLFPKGFLNEVQIVATVMSTDCETNTDIPAMLGASAALAISGVPFDGPVGAARVGYINGSYELNIKKSQLSESTLDLVVAGTKDAVLMVESEAKELTEETMLGALEFGHQNMQTAIDAITEFAAEVGTTAWGWELAAGNIDLEQQIVSAYESAIEQAYQVQEKGQRKDQLDEIKEKALQQFVAEDGSVTSDEVSGFIASIEKRTVRQRVLDDKPRIDGRDTKTVRPISIELGILPRAHGSVLFTRGETQAIVAATLGTDRDSQIIDALEGEYRDPFMLHYNFPPYCVGETGFMSGPKRREIGHGRLAKRGVLPTLPDMTEYPYTLRVVSEITESNGSSSMASVCGTSLSLMDAGVPVSTHVAGIAMGLIKEGDQYAVLTDILGDEDHLGDMDFKVAGTLSGITALQMDIKINGITVDIMKQALSQARDGRVHILGIMQEAIPGARSEMSPFAPKIITVQIKPEQIKDIIGKGGSTIKSITEETNTSIDISDTGLVKIAATNEDEGQEALRRVKHITMEIEIGKVYNGKVARLMDFGAFVTLRPGKDGLVHISQISQERVENVQDHLQEGQEVQVKVLDIDRQGKIKLSMKEV